MRFLANSNCLLLRSQANIIKSSRSFQWCSPILSKSIASNGLLSSVGSSRARKTFPSLSTNQNALQRFISSGSGKHANEHSDPKKVVHFTDDYPDHVSIYQGKYTHKILRVKMFSLATSAMGLLAQPILWHRGLEVGGTGLGVAMCSVAGVFTFITPLLLHFVTKKYVIDIKYHKKTDEYTCVTISFFLFKNETKFKVEDVHLPEVETMFTSMKIGPQKTPVFIDVESFTDTHHYARFMGYDKPLDFKFNDVDADDLKSSTDKSKPTRT